MQLTHSPIKEVLDTGVARNSAIAKLFIEEVRKKLDVQIVACYFQATSHISLPLNSTIDMLITSNNIEFIKETILTCYIRSTDNHIILGDVSLRTNIYDIFLNVLDETDTEILFERVFLPEEMAYYGWNNTKRSNWDMSLIIPSTGNSKSSHVVDIQSIDHLALWNYLSNHKNSFEHCRLISDLNAKIYCGFSEPSASPVYYIILSKDFLYKTDIFSLKKIISEYLFEKLKPLDRWNVITLDSVCPIIMDWNSLTPEQQFGLSKG